MRGKSGIKDNRFCITYYMTFLITILAMIAQPVSLQIGDEEPRENQILMRRRILISKSMQKPLSVVHNFFLYEGKHSRGCVTVSLYLHVNWPNWSLSNSNILIDQDNEFTVSPKRKYTLLSSQVLKTEGGQIKSRGCAKPTIELAQTGPSLILKLSKQGLVQFGPLQWWVWHTPYFSSSPPRF